MNFLTSDQKSGQRHGLVFRCPICPWKDALYFPLLTSGKTNGDPACDASVPMPTPSCLQEISQETKAGMEEEGFNKRWVRFQLLWGHLAGLRRYLPTGLSCLLEDLGKQPVAPGPPCLSKELYRKEQYCSTGRTGGSRERGCGQTITRLLSFLGKKPPEHYCPDWSENQGLWVGSSQWCLRLPEHPDESCCCQKGPGAASCSSACYGSPVNWSPLHFQLSSNWASTETLACQSTDQSPSPGRWRITSDRVLHPELLSLWLLGRHSLPPVWNLRASVWQPCTPPRDCPGRAELAVSTELEDKLNMYTWCNIDPGRRKSKGFLLESLSLNPQLSSVCRVGEGKCLHWLWKHLLSPTLCQAICLSLQ